MNMPMLVGRRAILAVAVSLVAFANIGASGPPDATITIHGGGVGFIAGVNWGSGTLYYHGQRIPLKVSGLVVGTIGATKYSATGEVYNLKKISDIDGTYAAMGAGATLAGGGSVLTMSNGAGVQITVRASSAGLELRLGPSGLTIQRQ